MSRVRRVAAAALASALALSACTSGRDDVELSFVPPAPEDAELRTEAGLEPCPEAPPAQSAGERLPEPPLPCLGDRPAVSLAGLSGAPTLVNLWASWCGPCIDELPALQAVHSDSGNAASGDAASGDGDSDLRVVGVLTQDRARQGLAAAAGLGVTFPSVVDDQGGVLRSLGLKALPATVFLRADGTVAHTYVGPALDEATARRLAAEHLGVAA
jgi:cytochrome c biogenesis protein CcmG/thiol:disulfide interchange protein DsbE